MIWGIGMKWLPAVSAFVGAVVVVGLVAGLSPTVAAAETPAERCSRETSAYNSAWAASWAASHPGNPGPAPAPPVPYVCVDPGSPPTTTSSPPTTTPGLPTAQSPGGGPNAGANAPTNWPTYNGTPIVPVPGASTPGNPGVPMTDRPMVPTTGANSSDLSAAVDPTASSDSSDPLSGDDPAPNKIDPSSEALNQAAGTIYSFRMGDSGQISMIGCWSWSCAWTATKCAASIAAIVLPLLKFARIVEILTTIAVKRPDLAWRMADLIEKINNNPNPRSIWTLLKAQPDIMSIIAEIAGITTVMTTCGNFLNEAFGDDEGNGEGGDSGNGAGNGAGNGNGNGAGGQGGGGESAPATQPQQTQQAQQTQAPQQTYTPPPQTQEPQPTVQTPPPTVESTPPPKPHSCEPWPNCAV